MERQSLDIGRAVSYMFEEEDWIVKFLILTALFLFSFLIVPYFIVQGYVIDIIRRVGNDEQPLLPRWEAWGRYLSEGFMASVALFVYTLPIILPICCISMLATALSDSSGEMPGIMVPLILCTVCFTLIAQLAIYLIYFAGLIHYAESGQFNSFFQFGRLWNYVRTNLNNYGLALIVIFVAGMVGGFVPFVGSAWSQLVSAHLLGQLLDQKHGPVLDNGMEAAI